MIDINIIRENPEKVKDNIKKKFKEEKIVLVDEILKKDTSWRKLKKKVDELRAERNNISRNVSEAKKEGKDVEKLLDRAKLIPVKIEKTEEELKKLREEIDEILLKIPNFIHIGMPLGKDEKSNKELDKIGEIKKFEFEPKNHIELGEALGMLDFDSSAETSGTGFYYIEDELALLNQALIKYTIDTMVKSGYRYVETPLMLRGRVIKNVTDLNDMEAQIFKIDNQDLYLVGTSEHSLIGRYINKILLSKNLPIKQTSYSMCFRKEIGSHGIEEKGIFRTHQFNKIEMITICEPGTSNKYFEEMKNLTIKIFKSLKIPIRVLGICSGDLGDLKHLQVDIEAWSPVKKEYYEIGSCSNMTDAQARKLKIRVDGHGKRYVPHTLNNTAMATSRALIAILENYQQKDGSIKIPNVLVPYMNGKKVIKKQ